VSYAIYAGNVIAVFAVQSLIIAVSQRNGDITPKPGRFPCLGWYLQPISASAVFFVWAVVAITGHPGRPTTPGGCWCRWSSPRGG
jgi:hypothetical protein